MLELWIYRSITTYILTQSEGASFHCFVYFSDDTWVDDQILYSRDLNIWLGRDTEWLIYPEKKGNSTLAQLLFFLLELCIVPQEEGVGEDHFFCSRFYEWVRYEVIVSEPTVISTHRQSPDVVDLTLRLTNRRSLKHIVFLRI